MSTITITEPLLEKIELAVEELSTAEYLEKNIILDPDEFFDEKIPTLMLYNGTPVLILKHYLLDDGSYIPSDKDKITINTIFKFANNEKPIFYKNKQIIYYKDLEDTDKNQFNNFKIFFVYVKEDSLSYHQKILYENS